MKKIHKYMRGVVVILGIVILSLSSSSFARQVTTSSKLEINCCVPHDTATKYTHPADPKTQLSLGFDGILLDGYKKGLAKVTIDKLSYEELNTMSEEDLIALTDITSIHVVATCIGSKQSIDIYPDMSLKCNKGDGLEVKLYSPTCPGKKGIFKLSKTTDIDDEEESFSIKQQNSTESFIPEKKILETEKVSTKTLPVVVDKKPCIIQ